MSSSCPQRGPPVVWASLGFLLVAVSVSSMWSPLLDPLLVLDDPLLVLRLVLVVHSSVVIGSKSSASGWLLRIFLGYWIVLLAPGGRPLGTPTWLSTPGVEAPVRDLGKCLSSNYQGSRFIKAFL